MVAPIRIGEGPVERTNEERRCVPVGEAASMYGKGVLLPTQCIGAFSVMQDVVKAHIDDKGLPVPLRLSYFALKGLTGVNVPVREGFKNVFYRDCTGEISTVEEQVWQEASCPDNPKNRCGACCLNLIEALSADVEPYVPDDTPESVAYTQALENAGIPMDGEQINMDSLDSKVASEIRVSAVHLEKSLVQKKAAQ